MGKNKGAVEQITTRDQDFAQWYTDICMKAELADYSGVRGCMIVRPRGTAIWENIKSELDRRFKETGHSNVIMPLFIPESLLMKEAEHVEGFAPEVAWVTQGGNEVLPERLAVRPTSETLFCTHYSKIIHSYRDLPVLYNQWVSVVRWEKSTRPFLRTREFFWQEGHTAHATSEDADQEALRMLGVYRDVLENILAIPCVPGMKSESEKFAGAKKTYTLETLMYDGQALQAATSHHFGENFARAFDITFQDENGETKYVNSTSWGITTRTIGGMIMVHSDDRGLVLSPKVAPHKLILIPIATHKEGVMEACDRLEDRLKKTFPMVVDRTDKSPGFKFADAEMKGYPLRLEMGPRDIEEGKVDVIRRDTLEKVSLALDDHLEEKLQDLLDVMQAEMLQRAKKRMEEKTHLAHSKEEFDRLIKEGGFVVAPWSGSAEVEKQIKEECQATIRCESFENQKKDKSGLKDLWNGEEAKYLVHIARAY